MEKVFYSQEYVNELKLKKTAKGVKFKLNGKTAFVVTNERLSELINALMDMQQ